MFLQIHTLISYGASLLNRDQEGFAKRIQFGGTSRLRVSSQCLKRHWRTHQGPHALSTIPLGDGIVPPTIRSRLTFREKIRDRLVSEGIETTLATQITEEMMRFLLGESAKIKKAEDDEEKGKKTKGKKAPEATDDEDACRTNQLTVLGQSELDFIFQEARTVARMAQTKSSKKPIAEVIAEHFTQERKKNMRGLLLGAGLDAALFGRMVTSRSFDNIDAAIQVAHSMTVHAAQTEPDFFAAVDDLDQALGNKGSGHIGQVEITTGVYYGYVTVDLRQLLSNLGNPDKNDPLVGEVLSRLIHLIATVSPGAKLGSTAPHAYAQLVLVERGLQQPRSLANAFLRPIPNSQDLQENAYKAMSRHLEELTQMFGTRPDYRFSAMGPVAALAPSLFPAHQMPVAELARWASEL